MVHVLLNSNQSLLNQARSRDLSTLVGLETASLSGTSSPVGEEDYTSTEIREMQAYYAGLKQSHAVELGELSSFTEEDLDNFRGVM